jgi:hypothetical protein
MSAKTMASGDKMGIIGMASAANPSVAASADHANEKSTLTSFVNVPLRAGEGFERLTSRLGKRLSLVKPDVDLGL